LDPREPGPDMIWRPRKPASPGTMIVVACVAELVMPFFPELAPALAPVLVACCVGVVAGWCGDTLVPWLWWEEAGECGETVGRGDPPICPPSGVRNPRPAFLGEARCCAFVWKWAGEVWWSVGVSARRSSAVSCFATWWCLSSEFLRHTSAPPSSPSESESAPSCSSGLMDSTDSMDMRLAARD